ncbi:tripartite-type tricarboxylate transporter receptor subunit TctC [Variovorax paradoxus]|uniref:tripartite tricarboxylate transporter substrate-binding protein n=1 Tax=Variovorax paradoxus TaxID=34073 RepID=UPI00277FEEAD|nr:tripartite tricarboxylate transporter substrate-binding protein [Variovorax paradoxus]MDP9962957.1 tripartite-type tricarboxylate transporter receptor subunit TctC [Variovorax paradoxus]
MAFFSRRKHLIAAGAIALTSLAAAQPVAAPNIKILVGFPAGGAPDSIARAFADQLRLTNGAVVIVENRPGASGKIAIDALLSGPMDGDTVALIPSSVLALTPQVVKAAKYDSVRDFVALGSLAEYGFGIAVGPAAKVTSISAYKDWARAHPAESSFATPGQGTPQHFLGAQVQKLLDIELTHVPYKGGASAVSDVIGGQIPLLITTEQLLVPHEGQSRLKTLLVTSHQRNPKLPNVPTAREAGLPQLESTDWFGLFAKAGTPASKVSEWKSSIAKVLASPRYQEAMANTGYSVPARQPDDFIKLLTHERAVWSERVRLAGFTAAN